MAGPLCVFSFFPPTPQLEHRFTITFAMRKKCRFAFVPPSSPTRHGAVTFPGAVSQRSGVKKPGHPCEKIQLLIHQVTWRKLGVNLHFTEKDALFLYSIVLDFLVTIEFLDLKPLGKNSISPVTESDPAVRGGDTPSLKIKSLGGESPVAHVFPSTCASPNPAAKSILLPALP